MCNFSFGHNVFKCCLLQRHPKVSVCGKGLRYGLNDIVLCHKCPIVPYIRIMEDNYHYYVLFDIIADGNFFFPEKKKCWNPVSVCYCERPSHGTRVMVECPWTRHMI